MHAGYPGVRDVKFVANKRFASAPGERCLGQLVGAQTRNGRVAPAAASSLVWLRAGGYRERRKATRSDFSCLVNPMPNRVS